MKVRLALYMHSPRLGGAEGYLGELIAGLDRDRFDITYFGPAWPRLDRFLRLEELGAGRVVVPVLEPGARRRPVDDGADETRAHGAEAPASLPRRVLAPIAGGSRLREPVRVLMHSVYWRHNRRAVQRALEANPVDVFHVINGGYPGSGSARAAVVAARDVGVRARLMTVCSTALPRSIRVLEERIDRAVAASVERIIAPAARPIDALVHHRGFSHGVIRTIPWGIDAPIPGTSEDRLAARSALGIPPGYKLVGSIGNFTPQKGQAVIVRAVSEIRASHPDLRVVLAGSGPVRDDVKGLVSALGLDDVITFPGRIDDPFTFLRALDLFVLASEIEGLPLVVLEALSQGCPVVATDVGGMSEAIVDGDTGALVPPGDPQALALALHDALASTRLIEWRGPARRRYEERFTLEAMLTAHEAVYDELLERDG